VSPKEEEDETSGSMKKKGRKHPMSAPAAIRRRLGEGLNWKRSKAFGNSNNAVVNGKMEDGVVWRININIRKSDGKEITKECRNRKGKGYNGDNWIIEMTYIFR